MLQMASRQLNGRPGLAVCSGFAIKCSVRLALRGSLSCQFNDYGVNECLGGVLSTYTDLRNRLNRNKLAIPGEGKSAPGFHLRKVRPGYAASFGCCGKARADAADGAVKSGPLPYARRLCPVPGVRACWSSAGLTAGAIAMVAHAPPAVATVTERAPLSVW